MSDPNFADSLFANPEQVFVDYDLTAEERAALKVMTRADIDAFAKASPEERKSLATVNHNKTALRVRLIINKEK